MSAHGVTWVGKDSLPSSIATSADERDGPGVSREGERSYLSPAFALQKAASTSLLGNMLDQTLLSGKQVSNPEDGVRPTEVVRVMILPERELVAGKSPWQERDRKINCIDRVLSEKFIERWWKGRKEMGPGDRSG